jgi:O-antigen/teichoic acid export membrane protein
MERIKKKLVRDGVWATAGKGLLALATLAVNALLTRLLPPSDIGIYFLLLSLVSVLALVAQAGMQQAIVRLVAEARGTGSTHLVISIIRSAYLVVAATTLLVCAVFASGTGAWVSSRIFHFTLPDEVAYMAAAWIAAFAFRSLIAETFRGFHDIKYASLFEGLLDGLVYCCLLGVLYVLYTHSDLNQVILLAIVSSCLNIFIASIFLRKKLKTRLIRTGGYEPSLRIRQIISTAWPLWVTSITLFVLAQTDLWIMGMLREQSEVGVYGAVRRLALLVSMSLTIVNSVVPPLIAEMNANKEHDKLEQALRATSTVAALPSFIALALFIFGAEPILRIIYGEYYAVGASILITLSLGQLVNVWCGSCGYVLMMTGHQVAMMKISILCGVISVALAFSLAPRFGGLGAAASVSTALILQNLLMLVAVRRHLGIWTQIDIRLLWRQFSRPHSHAP